jgi:hypothetical protein
MKPNAREAELRAMREAVFERVSTVAPSTPPSTASTPSQAVDAARRKRAARQPGGASARLNVKPWLVPHERRP